MPLQSVPAADAQASLRRNRVALWPDARRDGRRLEGLVLPAVQPSFRLTGKERVFTAGSCFARNIEHRLAELGFRVPARAIALPPEERGSDTANDILNKYNPHSIVNELIWAFEQPFDEGSWLEVGDGLWHDPHLAGNASPAPIERLRERRAAVTRFFSQLPRCRTIIVTLGLVEAWYDRRTQLYLNTAPPSAVLEREPDRFRCDVLSYGEIMAELERLWQLIRKHGHRKSRMLITVSPVPLRATFTGQDVLVANSYSKSVLRAAAGELATRHREVDYFPSYEAAMLTARPTAFMEDNRHVAPELVKAIIDRVVASYIVAGQAPAGPKIEAEADENAEAEPPLSQRIRQHLKMGRTGQALKLLGELDRHGSWSSARYDEFQFRYAFGKTLVDADSLLQAELQLARCCELQPRSALAHYAHARVLSRLQRPLRAEAAFRKVAGLDPSNLDGRLRLARLEARNDKLPDAEQTALAVLAEAPGHEKTEELLAEIRALAAAGWTSDASDALPRAPASAQRPPLQRAGGLMALVALGKRLLSR